MSKRYKALVMGGSAGFIPELLKILPVLPGDFRLPVIIAAHVHPMDDGEIVRFYNDKAAIAVEEAQDKAPVKAGVVYFSPSDHHLLVEPDQTFSLDRDKKVTFARPSIDVLFQSAGFAFGERLIGVLMTGSSIDGAQGLLSIKKYGGTTIVQEPGSAECPVMPQAGIDTGCVDKILTTRELIDFLTTEVIS